MQLHLAIAAAARNTLVRHLVESIRGPMKEVIRKWLQLLTDPSEFEQLQIRHEEIVAAVARGDPEVARRVMELHFDRAVARFVAAGLGGTPEQAERTPND